jgi:hypothetical protein
LILAAIYAISFYRFLAAGLASLVLFQEEKEGASVSQIDQSGSVAHEHAYVFFLLVRSVVYLLGRSERLVGFHAQLNE